MTAYVPARRWGVVVPVKRLERAKTRLSGYADQAREDLALAFAADVVSAALAAPSVEVVVVVTDDVRAADLLSRLGAVVVADEPGAGLNAALEHGEAVVRRRDGELGIAAVSSDLPALRSADLEAVLGAVPPGARAFVGDIHGTGTTLLATAGPALAPQFGPGSRDRHASSGALPLAAADGVRWDVDTPSDLAAAAGLGLGRCTTATRAA